MKPTLKPDAVGVFVLRGSGDETRLLLLRRGGGVFARAWTPVMGGIEPGERATQTARREVREETGLEDLPLFTLGIVDTFYDPIHDRVIVVPFFVARTGEERVRTDAAHDAHRWVTFDEALQLLTFGSHRRALPEIRAAFVDAEPEPWRALD